MTFEKYRDSIIEDFKEDYKKCQILGRDLTKEEIEDIQERFEDHRSCFEQNYEDFCSENEELITACIYGDNISASIECRCCYELIIDDVIIAENDIDYK